MSRNRLILLAALVLFVLLLVARETGTVRLNLHSSSIGVSQTVTYVTAGKSGDQPLSFDITLTHNGRTWMEHRKAILGQPRASITGDLDTTYSGNTWLPLRKSFTMTYECDLVTPEGTSPTFNGEISGEVTATITGLCSRQEARRLALEAAKKQIREYVLSMDP